jgi:hypothetical protein
MGTRLSASNTVAHRLSGMGIDTLALLLGEAYPPGIYRFADREAAPHVLRRVRRHGWLGWHLNGRAIASKADFLAACARAMRFPSYFGRNWDAFEECITDLSWLPAAGYVLLYEAPNYFAADQPREWQTAFAVLGDATAYWRDKGVPFYVLLRKSGGAAPDVPLLV